jgi:adenylate kinase family enzyme
VLDGNYSRTREVTWSRATTFVWLDYPRWVGTWRTIRRTTGRLLFRHELWNGNRERWRNLLEPGHPIRWSWQQHPLCRANYEQATTDPRWAHVDVIRLRSPADTRALLEHLRRHPS